MGNNFMYGVQLSGLIIFRSINNVPINNGREKLQGQSLCVATSALVQTLPLDDRPWPGLIMLYLFISPGLIMSAFVPSIRCILSSANCASFALSLSDSMQGRKMLQYDNPYPGSPSGGGGVMSLVEVENMATLQSFTLGGSGSVLPW